MIQGQSHVRFRHTDRRGQSIFAYSSLLELRPVLNEPFGDLVGVFLCFYFTLIGHSFSPLYYWIYRRKLIRLVQINRIYPRLILMFQCRLSQLNNSAIRPNFEDYAGIWLMMANIEVATLAVDPQNP
jgi:hypothetical protein